MCGSIYIVYHHTVQVARAQDWCLWQWAKGKHHRLKLQRVKPPRVQVEVVVCVCVCVCVCVMWCGVIHVGGGGSVKVARKQLRKEKIGRTNWSQYNLSTWARRGLLLFFLSDAVIGNCQPPMSLKTWPPKLQQNISERQSLQSAQVFTRVLATDVFFSDLHCVVVVFLYINIMLL